MSAPDKQGWLELLTESKIRDFNEWRLTNLLVRPDISGMDFSSKDLSGALLNGIRCVETKFTECNLSKTNLVQAEMTNSNFQGADMTEALLMYGNLKKSIFIDSNLTRTNFMWAELRECDFSGSRMKKTIFVEAKMQNAKLDNVLLDTVYLKQANLEGNSWATG
jgi:uncharacterized protein YjbI with pentapeptide repeats